MNTKRKGKKTEPRSLQDLGKFLKHQGSGSVYLWGKIKFYNKQKRFGKIIPDTASQEVFFHQNSVKDGTPEDGLRVKYVAVPGKQGPEATEVLVSHLHLPEDSVTMFDAGVKCHNFALALNKCIPWKIKNKDRKIADNFLKNLGKSSKLDGIVKHVAARQKRMLELLNISYTIYPPFSATLTWRMVVGLGGESVHETSMTLHHVYGIPYIPGTALKGITRDIAIAELCDEIDEELDVMDALLSLSDISEVTNEEEKHKLIKEAGKVKRQDEQSELPKPETIKKISTGWDRFKSVQNVFGNQHEAGKIIFLDAFPETTPKLRVDIMNPHYPKYYSDQQAPSDWQNPVPIPFLTLEQSTFTFSLAVKKSEFGGDQLLHITAEWLRHALQEHGIGAKTAVGYGYFLAKE